jgi:glycosyltransferase involved in cell wall biosynthesis
MFKEPIKITEQIWSDDILPIVSIKCITYNHEKYVVKAIESFLMQKTTFRVEIVIGEDCSTDRTREIVFNYAKKYPSIIKIITSNQNVGVSLNGMRTLKAASGKYIALCEGDDYWTDPLKLQKQVDFLEANERVGMVYTNVKEERQINETEFRIHEKFTDYKNYSNIEDYVQEGSPFLNTCTFFFRASVLTRENIILIQKAAIGDLALVLATLKCGFRVSVMNEITAIYRVLNYSASHDTDSRKIALFFLNKLKIELLFITNKRLRKEIKRIYYTKYFHEFGPRKLEFDFFKRIEIVMILLKNKSKLVLIKYLFHLE